MPKLTDNSKAHSKHHRLNHHVVKLCLLQRGINQRTCATHLGVSEAYLSRLICGTRPIPEASNILPELAAFLQVRPQELLERDGAK